MKKILIFLVIIAGFFAFGLESHADCKFDAANGDLIGTALTNCLEGEKSTLVEAGGVVIGGENDGFKSRIQSLIQTLGGVLAILAVGSIVYGSLLLVLSGGEEEKLKKGKDVVKWSIIGFLGVVFAGVLITIVVNIMFSI